MNFLAHLVLAGPRPESQIGGLIADFSRPAGESLLNQKIRDGIKLHRAIDAYTDQHPIVRRSRNRIAPPYRRAAGILVDVFYDHFLAVTWREYFPAMELEIFAQQIYAMLQSHEALLPEPANPMVTSMIRDDWLTSYRDPNVIPFVIDRIAKRLSRPEILLGGGAELARNGEELATDFRTFFPDVMAFSFARRQGVHSNLSSDVTPM